MLIKFKNCTLEQLDQGADTHVMCTQLSFCTFLMFHYFVGIHPHWTFNANKRFLEYDDQEENFCMDSESLFSE
jgi:hypothetical protein